MEKHRKDGFCVTARTKNEIYIIAEKVREIFFEGCADLRYLDIVRMLEIKIPTFFNGFRYEIVEPSELPDREAEMSPSEYCIRIREDVYLKAVNGDGHCRFTLAHEIAHFFLHRTQVLAFGKKAEDGNIPIYQNSEWQADVFARSLLAPPSMTRGLTVDQVELLFGVSHCVAEIITDTEVHTRKNGFTQMTLNL